MRLLLLFLSALMTVACKNDKGTQIVEKELSAAEKIAYAHGYDQWDKVESIKFTFNVNRDSSHFERTWKWWPKTDKVVSMTSSDTLEYNRKNMDSISLNRDRGFINDKFWLLIPFQLMWDEGITISDPERANAPVTDITMNKITVTYSDGGYTPGDAYDIFYDDGYEIQEWTFRKGNAPEPSLSNTFENYEEHQGIRFAIDHRKKDEPWNLHFTNIEIELEE